MSETFTSNSKQHAAVVQIHHNVYETLLASMKP